MSDHGMPARRLTAVVFTDIVGFSALVNVDEALGARALDRQRRVVRHCLSPFGGHEIETAGDSFLLTFASAASALHCLVAIHRMLGLENRQHPNDPPVALRASLHLADIEFRGREIFGDGVNIAARLLPLSPIGGIALSDQVQAQIRNRVDCSSRSLGPCVLKNIRQPVEVFILDAGTVAAIPNPPLALPPPAYGGPDRGVGGRRRRAVVATVVVACVLAAACFGLLYGQRPMAEAGPQPQRIAVLPFETFSSGADDPLLAGGLQDGILTSLANLPGMSVISRTSVAGYRNAGPRNVRAIAGDLGVDTVIEGSLQRAGDRLLVQVQLIDARADRHLWAKSYERPVSDLFEVQGVIARDVAANLHARLSEADRRRLETRLGTSTTVAAFTEFRRAAEALERGGEGLPMARAAATRALTLDPNFALGHVLKAHLDLRDYVSAEERSERQLRKVKESLIRASELAPELAEVHRGWGSYYLYGRDDADSALAEFEAARAARPGDADTLRAIGGLHMRTGRMDVALRHLRRASELDPHSTEKLVALTLAQTLMRDYPAARSSMAAAVALRPDLDDAASMSAMVSFLAHGESVELQALATKLKDPEEQAEFAYYAGDIDAALGHLAQVDDWLDDGVGGAPLPSVWYRVRYLYGAGRTREALAAFAQAEVRLDEALTVTVPHQATQRAAQAVALAVLGRTAAAKALADSIRRDPDLAVPLMTAGLRSNLALVAMVVGDHAAAIDELDAALAVPALLSTAALRSDPLWKPLRSERRFIALLRDGGAGGIDGSVLLAQHTD